MGGTRLGVSVAVICLAGCLPRPEPAAPAQPQPPPPAYAYAPQAPPQPQPQPQAQPQPQPEAQPQAQPGSPPPYPQQGTPPPYPQQGTPPPYPQQGTPPPYPQQGTPPPYPQQGYPQQGYAQASYGYPQPYPAQPYVATETSSGRRLHDGEVIASFAVVGTFGAINMIDRLDMDSENLVAFSLLGGIAGGAGVGYMLTQKYDVEAGAARTTTLGMTLGMANGALLIEPTGWDRSESVLNFLFLGSAAGAAGGFIYGQHARPTSGQATFIANVTLLGATTAALGAIAGSRDGDYGGGENSALVVGLNGGAVAGAVIAPALDWSPRRARRVMAATVIGAFVGGMLTGLVARDEGESSREDGDLVAATMTAGMWGGFALGILMTKSDTPDAKFLQPTQPRTAARDTSATVAPWVGKSGQLGVMTGGTF